MFDSLGEAYATDGNTSLAIQAYERSLQLNPANTGGAEALKKLRAAAGRDESETRSRRRSLPGTFLRPELNTHRARRTGRTCLPHRRPIGSQTTNC